jgi:hypothetical protein
MRSAKSREKTTRPRRFTVTVRTFMVSVLLVGGVPGWSIDRAATQQRAVTVIARLGGWCSCDLEVDDGAGDFPG